MDDNQLWRDRSKIFVAGIPLNATEEELHSKFEQFGEMHQAKIVYDKKTGRSRGFGFVTYADFNSCLDAVAQMNKTKWNKRVLNVRLLDAKQGSNGESVAIVGAGPKPSPVEGPRPEGCVSVYIGNLAYEITEETVRKVFSPCGDIKAIRFTEDMKTGEFRGFGYVQFYEGEAVDEAVKLNGKVIMGRIMKVDYADSTPDTKTNGVENAVDLEDSKKKLKKGLCRRFLDGKCDRGTDCKFAHKRERTTVDGQAETHPSAVDEEGHGRAMDNNSSTEMHESTIFQPNVAEDAPVCLNFQKGTCKRGENCRFRHIGGGITSSSGDDVGYTETSEMLSQDHSAENSMSSSYDATADETQSPTEVNGVPVCMNFQKGKCKRGVSCRFYHGTLATPCPPHRTTAAVVSVAKVKVHAPTADYRTDYQKRFQNVCYNWQKTQSCVRGDSCPFDHSKTPSNSTSSSSVVQTIPAMVPSKKRKKFDDQVESQDQNQSFTNKTEFDDNDSDDNTKQEEEHDEPGLKKKKKKEKKEKKAKKDKKKKKHKKNKTSDSNDEQ